MKLILKTTNDKIHKYTKLNAQLLERTQTIESQLKTYSSETPLPILQAEQMKLTESVNKLQSRADEMRQRNVSTVGLIENLSAGKIDVCFVCSTFSPNSWTLRTPTNCNELAIKRTKNTRNANDCVWTWLMVLWKAIRNRSKIWLKTRRLKLTEQRVLTSINTNEPSLILCRCDFTSTPAGDLVGNRTTSSGSKQYRSD